MCNVENHIYIHIYTTFAQRHHYMFIMHISLTGKDCQILPGQYLAIFGRGNMHNERYNLPVAIFSMHVKYSYNDNS